METRQLGNSDLFITPIGFGLGPLAAVAGSSAGDRRTTPSRSRRSAKRSTPE